MAARARSSSSSAPDAPAESILAPCSGTSTPASTSVPRGAAHAPSSPSPSAPTAAAAAAAAGPGRWRWHWSRLPHEVLLQIMCALAALGDDLRPSLLVCAAWSEAAVAQLWHRPIITRPATLAALTAVLARAHDGSTLYPYPRFVRRVNLTPLGRDWDGAHLDGLALCTRLERLVLPGCVSLTDAQVSTVVAACPHLVSVDLSGVPVGTQTLQALAKAHRLQAVGLSECELVTGAMVARLARGCPLLKRAKLDGADRLTDQGVIALAQHCPQLVDLDLTDTPYLTDAAVRALWTHAEGLRELRIQHSANLTSAAFPDPDTGELPPPATASLPVPLPDDADTWDPPAPASVQGTAGGSSPVLLDAGLGAGVNFAQSLTLGQSQTSRPPLVMGRHLRLVDFTGCEQLTDAAIRGLTVAAPHLRSVTISKCPRLTDASIEALCVLGKGLHLVHLGRLEQATDAALVRLVHACSRLRYMDVAYCTRLTDRSVQEIARLPKLKRIGLVKMPRLTKMGVYALSACGTLERIHLSYCDQLSLPPIFNLLLALPHLTHLSLTAIPAFRRTDLQQFCRPCPKDLTANQRASFCVFSGPGIAALRDHMTRHLFPHGTADTTLSLPVAQRDLFLTQCMWPHGPPLPDQPNGPAHPAAAAEAAEAADHAPRHPLTLTPVPAAGPEQDEDDAHFRAVEAAQRQRAIYNPLERPWSAAHTAESVPAGHHPGLPSSGDGEGPANDDASDAPARPHHHRQHQQAGEGQQTHTQQHAHEHTPERPLGDPPAPRAVRDDGEMDLDDGSRWPPSGSHQGVKRRASSDAAAEPGDDEDGSGTTAHTAAAAASTHKASRRSMRGD